MRKVGVGNEQVGEAGPTMREVVAAVRGGGGNHAGHHQASREQGASIAEVNAAMAGLDAITRQNAALVQQSAGASNSVAQEAASLAKAMSVFRLPGGHETAARRTAPQFAGERGLHRQGVATAALMGGARATSKRMSPANGGAGTRVTQ